MSEQPKGVKTLVCRPDSRAAQNGRRQATSEIGSRRTYRATAIAVVTLALLMVPAGAEAHGTWATVAAVKQSVGQTYRAVRSSCTTNPGCGRRDLLPDQHSGLSPRSQASWTLADDQWSTTLAALRAAYLRRRPNLWRGLVLVQVYRHAGANINDSADDYDLDDRGKAPIAGRGCSNILLGRRFVGGG